MAGPIDAAGATRNPTRYAALTMGSRQMTGLDTQRSPYRDAKVPYVAAKYYSASRFDSIIDGINREITTRLTDKRRPGSSVFNNNTFPAINSFFSWNYVQNNQEIVRTLVDGADGTIYDATPGQKTALYTKSAGAGPARFLAVNTQLFIYDGVDTTKILQGGITWQANKNVDPGTLINQGAAPGVIYMALGGISLPIVATAVSGAGSSWQHLVYIDPTRIPAKFANLVGVNVTFSGLTHDTTLNGQTRPVDAILSSTLGILQVTTTTGAPQAYITDTGSGSTGNGVTGGSAPSFNPTRLSVTQDAGQQWKSYGTSVQETGLTVPTNPPTLTPIPPDRFWQQNTAFPVYTSLLDNNGNIEVVASIAGTNQSGASYPTWAAAPAQTQLVSTNVTGTPTGTGNVFGGIYQNTSANTELHSGWGMVVSGGGIAYFELLVGATNPPTQNVWGTTFSATVKAGTGGNGKLGFEFSVPPGWYYEMQAFGDVSPTPGGWFGSPLQPVSTGTTTPGGANAVTVDGGLTWYNLGQPGGWQGDAANAGIPSSCLLDSNGNLQWLFSGVGGVSGTTTPVWGTTLGATTVDGGLTWVCISTGGSGAALTYQSLQYAYSLHAIDGSVTTASPVAVIFGGILGDPDPLTPRLTVTANLGTLLSDTQFDQIWIWRTAQGQATLILEDQIPIDGLTTTFTYTEYGIPDTSATGGAQLNPFQAAPVASANNPPPSNMTAPTYYLQRQWGIVDNMVVYSGGPDTIVGNGSTSFPPLNEIPYPSQPIRLIPVTVQSGGLLVLTTDGVWIILGLGTSTSPFYTTPYYATVSVTGYNAIDVFNNQVHLMEANGKVSTLAIEYPFNPQTGYTEVGFPIGDQFRKVTTGGINATLYNPATAFLAWNVQSTNETAMYVADGAVGWFRMGILSDPESGLVWNTRAAIAGGTSAVQSIETSSGRKQLLIGPATSGPILMRDDTGTVYDDNGTPYPAWDAKGVNILCSTGQWAEVSHISSKSTAAGIRPIVSVLLNEIQPSPERPYNVLQLKEKSNDPPLNRRSRSVYSDRYVLAQNGVEDTGDCILTRFDYGSQAVGDELLDWAIYASVHDERQAEAEKPQ